MKYYTLLVLLFFFLGCGFFQSSSRKEIDKITKLNNGYFTTVISLKRVASGWNVWIGDPYKAEEILEKNKSLQNKKLTVIVKNINNFGIRSNIGGTLLQPGGELIFFSGTFDTLITATAPILFPMVPEPNYKYLLSIQFEDNSVKIEYPIPIIGRHTR